MSNLLIKDRAERSTVQMRRPFVGARYQRKNGARDIVTVLRNDVRYFGEPGILIAFDSCSLPRPWYEPDGTAKFNAEQFAEWFSPVENVVQFMRRHLR